MSNKIETVHKFKDGRLLIKISTKLGAKYAFAKGKDILLLKDNDGDISGIQFFDDYKISEDEEVIIKVLKRPDEWYNTLRHFDLSDTTVQATEVPGGPFNIGPYAKQYYKYKMPTKTIDDIIPKKLKYSHGLVNSKGTLTVYPQFDEMRFSGDATCIAGNLFVCGSCKYGYLDCETGKALTPMEFEEAHNFSEERAIVKYKNRYGFIDRCKVMTDAKDNKQYAEGLHPYFYRVTPFQDGVTTVVTSPANIFCGESSLCLDRNGNFVSSGKRKRQYVKQYNTQNSEDE